MAYYWLLQAHSISSQIGIKEDEWEQLSTLGYFFLEFRSRRDADACRDMPTLNRPMYLVVEPIPRASDDENKRKAWARGEKYYWCFDPLGAEEVTEDVQLSLGLPSLTCKIMLDNRYWKRDTYDAVQMLHTYNGFNPLSTCLAQVLEIVKEGETIIPISSPTNCFSVEGPLTESFGKSTGTKLDSGVDDMIID
ncbi:hypothetical protein VNI00_001046 [Paramarasmius palmivorus]|uniref:Uncharacterized protein n=1 Tax=Paramarasmius palmivorus TaxID=297713 RepID=A0AAW0E7V0_9AGAR